jgi:Domain of unknown function (DUF4105)
VRRESGEAGKRGGTEGKPGSREAEKRGRSAGSWITALAALFFGLASEGLCAQVPAPPPPRLLASPQDTLLRVYLMTMGPGKYVWERFGHNAIWIHDPVRGTDQTYNYGLFDFGQQNFLLRFIQGRMWYWMQGFPAQSYVESYRRVNRSVWVQELEIAPRARRELQAFLEWNERPENRFYHYDYYRDNCSTRVRDALDHALGGRIREHTSRLPTGRTYRFHTLRLTANDPPIYTGLLLALGQPVDRPISAWEEMFLPLAMRVHLRNLTVPGPDGRAVPLVRSERTLFQSSEAPPPPEPPAWLSGYFGTGLVIGGLAFGLALAAPSSRLARFGFLAVAWIWLLLSGTAGLIVAGLWGLTNHSAAYRNENILQADLLALALLWPVTRLVFGSQSAARPAVLLATVVLALSLLGILLKLLPYFYQVNGGIVALALPAHAGMAAAIWQLGRTQKPRTRRAPSRASG